MISINYSNFCRAIYNKSHNAPSESALVVRMFKSVNSTHFAKCEDSDDYAGKLFRGSKPITQNLRNSVPKIFNMAGAYDFFAKVIPINSVKRIAENFALNDPINVEKESLCLMCARILNAFCVSDAEDITQSYQDFYDEAVNNPHFSCISDIVPEETAYILEMLNCCPLCKSSKTTLVIDYEGKQVRNFKIAKIYPDSLPANLIHSFNLIKRKPHDLEHSENKIALCLAHYNIYTSNPTPEVYNELLMKKQKAKELKDIQTAVNDQDLRAKIIRTLDSILKIDPKLPLAKLSNKALRIADKIPEDDVVVYGQIKFLVASFYKHIDEHLSKYEAKYADKSTELGRKIKGLSDRMMALVYSYNRVIEELTKAIDNELPNEIRDKLSCRVLVAYFIQHCEVLSNEVSE